MATSATETHLILTGAESPIASIEIDGNLVDFTAYDGTLASVTAGTPYTLLLSGFNTQDDAFFGTTTLVDFYLSQAANIFTTNGERQSFEKSLTLGDSDSYTLSINKDWLADEGISSYSATSDGLTVRNVNVLNNILQFEFTGASLGLHEITFDYSTPTRSRQYKAGIRVV